MREPNGKEDVTSSDTVDALTLLSKIIQFFIHAFAFFDNTLFVPMFHLTPEGHSD